MSSSGFPQPPPAAIEACYRHPKLPAPVTCNRCQRPICSECMVSAPVGWQCPSCLKDAPPVRRMRDVQAGGFGLAGGRPYLTFTLLGACVAAYVAQQGAGVEQRFVLVAAEVARGEWWRVVTSGFLHGNPIHLLFNMLLLFQLGSALEQRLGRARFIGIYVLSLVSGSMGAMLLQSPTTAALGASGAVFGLMGALLVLSRRTGSPIEAGVGGLLVINLIITFVIPGISVGGHVGGLAAGLLGGLLVRAVGEGSDLRRVAATTAVLVVLTAGLFVATGPVAQGRCEQQQSSLRRPAPTFFSCP